VRAVSVLSGNAQFGEWGASLRPDFLGARGSTWLAVTRNGTGGGWIDGSGFPSREFFGCAGEQAGSWGRTERAGKRAPIELPFDAISVRRMYYEMFCQMKKQLAQVSVWFDAAEALATENAFSVDLFLEQRLTMNQFSLVRQVQIACDTAKLGASRLTGREAPKHEDNETTLAQLRARLAEVISYLDDFSAADFAKAGEQTISQPRWNGKTMTGADFFIEHVVPNFFFHLGHTYAILRHNGVKIGKRDYLGKLTQAEPS
jgi:hypothetical protein